MTLTAIKNPDGTIDEFTLADSEEEAWDKCLGFEAVDDQWEYRKQKMLQKGCRCVIVELKEVDIAKESKDYERTIKENPELG